MLCVTVSLWVLKRRVAFPTLLYTHHSGGLMQDGLERSETKSKKISNEMITVVKVKNYKHRYQPKLDRSDRA